MLQPALRAWCIAIVNIKGIWIADFFFPAVAITAWAQQTNPAAAKAEKALRARVEQFFQLQVDKKFRQVEPMVAADSKDLYYNASKPDLKAFEVQKVELLDHNTRASNG